MSLDRYNLDIRIRRKARAFVNAGEALKAASRAHWKVAMHFGRNITDPAKGALKRKRAAYTQHYNGLKRLLDIRDAKWPDKKPRKNQVTTESVQQPVMTTALLEQLQNP